MYMCNEGGLAPVYKEPSWLPPTPLDVGRDKDWQLFLNSCPLSITRHTAPCEHERDTVQLFLAGCLSHYIMKTAQITGYA